MSDEPVNPVDEELAAIARIGFTPDGILLHRHLRRILETVVDMPESGALLSHNGRRSLARDLMAQMREGIDSGGRHDPANQPILAGQRRPVAVDRRRGIRRRVLPDPDLSFGPAADEPADDAGSEPWADAP
jgi:hypothetical protein